MSIYYVTVKTIYTAVMNSTAPFLKILLSHNVTQNVIQVQNDYAVKVTVVNDHIM